MRNKQPSYFKIQTYNAPSLSPTRMTPSPDRRITAKHLWIPLLWLPVTAPIWLQGQDSELFYALNSRLSSVPDGWWAGLSLLGTGWAVYALCAWTLWRAPQVMLAWLCAAPLAGLFTRIGKMMADNPRPLEALGPEHIHVIGDPLFVASMPSGHTMTAFAAATAIYFSLQTARRHRFAGLFVVACGVGLSRIAVGAHWPADVAVGAGLGIASGLGGAWVASRLPTHLVQVHSGLVRAVAVFGVYCLYVLLDDPMGFAINRPLQLVLGSFLAACLMVFLGKTIQPEKQD